MNLAGLRFENKSDEVPHDVVLAVLDGISWFQKGAPAASPFLNDTVGIAAVTAVQFE